MAQRVLRYGWIGHDLLKDAVQAVGGVGARERIGKIEKFLCLRADRDFFVFNFSVFTFGIARDEEVSFKSGVGKFAGAKPEKQEDKEELLIGSKLGFVQALNKPVKLIGR